MSKHNGHSWKALFLATFTAMVFAATVAACTFGEVTGNWHAFDTIVSTIERVAETAIKAFAPKPND